jgi:hypothetical protein
MGQMKVIFGAVIMAFGCLAGAEAHAEPLVTISCGKPNGFNIAYGTSLIERFEASEKKQPELTAAQTNRTERRWLWRKANIRNRFE